MRKIVKFTHRSLETEARGNDLANQIPQWELIRVSILKVKTKAIPIRSPYPTYRPVRPSPQIQQKANGPIQPIFQINIRNPHRVYKTPESENADLLFQASIRAQFVTRKSLPLAG